ncbi:Os11g0138950 [Oryza sativa Japonica Group]|uniref:Os11g0138950 protein n=1 Tax=Oryza sativa subsp. japonica TaxID=39947 RepID=A0A0P0XYP3_ORYSJ|nr:hypothetical protein EE612_053391 [Oryza sativa]BAT12593.1 Os11g0138950 [Oryza sativa Japonica Group]
MNGVGGFSSSDGLFSGKMKPGWSWTPPARRIGSSASAPASPARAATLCTRTPPALSPMRNTREKSAAPQRRSTAGCAMVSLPPDATSRSQSSAACPASMAAGRRCSGASGRTTETMPATSRSTVRRA